MNKKTKQNDTIDLLRLAKALWHRAWAVVLSMLVFGAGAFSYTYFLVTPLYQASALMYVNNSTVSVGSTSISMTDLTASQSLVDTYIVVMKAWPFLEEIIEAAELDYSYDELASMIAAAAVDSTEVFQITVTSASPEEAEKIANTIAELLPDRISEIVDGSSARIVAGALTPSSKASPDITKNTAKGLLFGAFLSCGIIILLALADDRIRDEDELLNTYDLPLLASIPDLMASGKGSRYYRYESKWEGD